MTDREMCREVASLWIYLGGDSEGIEWCWRQIQKEVQTIEEDKQQEAGEKDA